MPPKLNNVRSAAAQLTRGGRFVSVRSRPNGSNGSGRRLVRDFVRAIIVGHFAFYPWETIQMAEYSRTMLREIEERPGGAEIAAKLRNPLNWFAK